MKTPTKLAALAAALVLTGCANVGDTLSGGGTNVAAYADDVPTEDEAAETAASEIDASNADQEFLKLKAEIEGGSDDF